MIVDNFDIIRGLLKFEDKDDFYFLQIIQRKKDGNQVPSANNGYRTIKTYYIDICISDYESGQIELALTKGNFGDVYAFVRSKKQAQTKPPQKEPFKIGEIKYSKTIEL